MRVDIDSLTSNEELFNNNHEIETFNLDSLSQEENLGRKKIQFDEILSDVPDTINTLREDYNPISDSVDKNFDITQRINEMQILILTQTMQVLFERYKKSSDAEILGDILNVSSQLSLAKKSLLDSYKDLAKINKDGSVPTDQKISVGDGATLNIQNNYSGTPNDILKQSGDSVDMDYNKYIAKTTVSEEE